MIFGSDNMVGASPAVLAGIVQANAGEQASYGADIWCEQAEQRIAHAFQAPVKVFFVSTGTVANSLALSALVPPWGGVLCQRDAHVLADESSAPEFFSGGARLIGLDAVDGKLAPQVLERALAVCGHPPHNVVPRALSITQANELGLVYTPEEVRELAVVAHRNGLKVHMDGARFANALASLGCQPADITWRAGVDVLCLGASKNGALMAEAIVFFDLSLAQDFAYRVKRAGQMAAKARLFGAQFSAWLQDDHWLELARQANDVAGRLGRALQELPGARVVWPVQANEVFAVMPKALAQALRAQGAVFYDWPEHSLPAHESLKDDEMLVRLVTSFASTAQQVDELLAAARAA